MLTKLQTFWIHDILSEEDAVDACELIANLAKCADGISEDDVLADLASYRSKSGLWSKPFIWSSCHKIEPVVWWNGMCSGRPLSVIATKILSLPTTSSACEIVNAVLVLIPMFIQLSAIA